MEGTVKKSFQISCRDRAEKLHYYIEGLLNEKLGARNGARVVEKESVFVSGSKGLHLYGLCPRLCLQFVIVFLGGE